MEIWCFSGINSVAADGEVCELGQNYVAHYLKKQALGIPLKEFTSELGTFHKCLSSENDLIKLKNIFNTEERLDDDADKLIAEIDRSHLRGKEIRIILTAPKTMTFPRVTENHKYHAYFGYGDLVPNMTFINLQDYKMWRREIEKKPNVKGWVTQGRGGLKHNFKGFFNRKNTVLKRKRVRKSHLKKSKWEYRSTSEKTPNPIDTIRNWVNDSKVDYIFVGHSQGCNVITRLLRYYV